MDLDPLEEKLKSFGWDVNSVDGHKEACLEEAIVSFNNENDLPRAIIAKTIFGKGVSFMENKLEWYYQPMSEDDYLLAKEQVQLNA